MTHGTENEIDLIELFSGIGGFTKGLTQAGFKINNHYYSEIDKHAIANYKYNFPNAEYIGSVTDVSEWRISRPSIITFGSPCQDFSLAGKGLGLDGNKSSLIKYAIMAIERFRPDVFIWENVKGAFSTNDSADYWAIIQAFANIPGYRFEQQLVNTAWVLPQNRERIYIVGHLTERSERRVFPFAESPTVHKVNNRTEKPRVANCLDANYFKWWLDHGARTHIVVKSLTETRTEEAKMIRRESQKQGRDFSPRRGKELTTRKDENANTITSTQTVEQLILIEGRIRRLTEIEFERLQGFPDDWTKYGVYDKQVWTNKKEGTFTIVQGVKEIPRGQRYKLCGNAVTVDIVEMIAKRLLQANEISSRPT